VVVIAVEDELDIIAFDLFIAAGELRLDLLRLTVVETDADVDGRVIDQKARFSTLGCRLTLVWIVLPEVGDRSRRLPRCFVEPAIDLDRSATSCCCRDRSLVVWS
jgi:hypothetical protein